ncbi:uncharacterized protein LOC119114952 [Pollicipes pollicipes]|uniref:uncharacterized protein LOC119114952 n=1 Tax=Pollicipes pollicipes TaxID=41117 RepID=UPI0018858213|nr:uncharacterized protein LOC119114952 [Pollicipes pollicipes]
MALLQQHGICDVVTYPDLTRPRSDDDRRLLEQHEQRSVEAQQKAMTLARHKQLLERADQIVDGKWKKLQQQRAAGRAVEAVSRHQLRFDFIERLRANVRPPPAAQCYAQLYCGHPLTRLAHGCGKTLLISAVDQHG